MNLSAHNYLFFVTKPYSFSILEPLQTAIRKSGVGQVRWFTASSAGNYNPPGTQLKTTAAVLEYNPEAIIVPGNVIPHFWPGLKVQIFHGLCEEKKGHYRITGFFDLYCTPGPIMTEKFNKLAEIQGHFLVRETGWPKLDQLDLSTDRSEKKKGLGLDPDRPVLLYAPTFSPKYTSANDLFPEIKELQNVHYQWLIKFHNLMDTRIVRQYETLASNQVNIAESHDIIPLMEAADVLITDTSSVAYEYLLVDRPIITYRAVTRHDKGINITTPSDLFGAIERVLNDPDELAANRRSYFKLLHPYQDGKSSYRVLEAIDHILFSNAHKTLQPKPRNWLRKRQIRRLIP